MLAFEAVLHWYHHYRNPKFAYRFSECDGFFSSAVKNRLAAQIPEFRDEDDGAFFYVSIPRIEFPESPFGYAEVVIGDPFYAERYVEVFEKTPEGWQIVDSITIASGTLDSIITEFDWPAYYRDRLQGRPKPPQGTSESVPPASAGAAAQCL